VIALWHIDSKSSQLKAEKFEKGGLHLFHSKYSMISTGTERLVACGLVDKTFQNQMKVPYQSGSFDLPIKYGYSLIVEGKDGKIGHLMHPHQNQIEVDEKEIFWTNNEIPPQRLALISNLETVINAIWDGMPTKNDTIGICGFGNIGSLLANTLKTHYGLSPVIIEQNLWRRQKAESLGFDTHEKGIYDLIFHTTATEAGLQFCIDSLQLEGRLVELSWYGNKKVNLALGRNFHYNRLKIISSQVSRIPGHMQAEHNYETRKKLAFQMLKDDSFDSLITNRIPFDESPLFFDNLRKGEMENGLIYVIEY
jgi:threonine dehydrogenase-like Zn-dependent dehydrogenase